MPIVGAEENQFKAGASRFLIFNQFDGMDTQADRIDLPVEKQAWLENLQPIARNKVQGVPAPAAAIYNLTGETVVRTFGNKIINGLEYVIAFCASGAAYAAQVIFNGYGQPILGGTLKKIAPAGTFSATGGDVAEWNAQRILIADSVSGYSTWDGNLFIRQGNASPNIAVTFGGFGYVNGATAQLIIVRTTLTVTAQGSGYVNGATVAITGGSGSGMLAIAMVVNGHVVELIQTNTGMGYLPGDVLTVTISPVSGGSGATATGTVAAAPGVAPTATVQVSNGVVIGLTLTGAGSGMVASDGITVIISPVSGGQGAQAVAHVWPFISPFPTTLAIAFGRVWLAQGRTLVVTGVGINGESYDDFSLSGASVTTTLKDEDLIQQITALRFLNNYLYILGDNSVKSIGGITVVNGVTAFSIITLSSDQGTTFLNSVISFNRLILFANTTGVHAVFGASVEKISGPMDGIFALADFTLPLQAAVNDLNNVHTFLLLIRYRDPLAPGLRSLILAYGDRKWYVLGQSTGLLSICTCVINGVTTTFGSSGSDISQLLQDRTARIPFRISTSLSAHGDPVNAKRVIRASMGQTSDECPDIDLIAESAELPFVDTHFAAGFRAAVWINNSGQIVPWQNNSGQIVPWASDGFTYNRTALFSQVGRYIGLTATGTINQETIHILWMEHQPTAPPEFTVCTPSPLPESFPPIPLPPPAPPPPPPPPPVAPAIYITGQSCELFRFPLTATGTPTPDVNITGTTSTLTGPLGNLQSNTLAVDVDTVTGQQYVLQQNKQVSDNKWLYSIPIFSPNVTGNVAPLKNIVGAATGLPRDFLEANFGGICLDGSKNIYVAFKDPDNTDVWKFPSGSNGNVPGTLLITDAGMVLTSLAYDVTNNLIWVGGYDPAAFTAIAKSYTTAGVLNSTLTSAAMIFPGEVFIGPTGQIVLSGTKPTDGTKTVVQVFPSGSSGAAAASQTITISAPQGPQVSCAAMDNAGLLYIGPVFDAMLNENIQVYAAGVTGVDPAMLRSFNSPLFKTMADGTATNITQIIVR